MNELTFMIVFAVGAILGAIAVLAYFHRKPDLTYLKNTKNGKAGHMEADEYFIGNLSVKLSDGKIERNTLYFTHAEMVESAVRAIREQNENK